MANYRVTDTELSTIASAIRLKGGTSEPLVFPSGFVSAISAIEKQGTYVSKIITENGEYDPASDNADAFSHVTVSVPTSAPPVLVSKSISQNGTYNPADDNADAYSQVVVNVSGGGGGSFPDFILTGESGSFSDDSISSLRDYAFYSHSEITGVAMDAVTNLGDQAFAECYRLDNASFPICTSIGLYAFYNCSRLSNASFPSCTRVGGSAFARCGQLSNMYLPKCTSIGISAFYSCSRLESIYLLASSIAYLGAVNVFSNTPIAKSSYIGHFGSIYVPASLVDSYKSATNWSAYSDRITSYVEG